MEITYPPELLPSPDEGDDVEIIIVSPSNTTPLCSLYVPILSDESTIELRRVNPIHN